MWESILTWFLGWVLKYLADKATRAVIEANKEAVQAKERGETNDANVKAYEAANDRLSRIQAAERLLNRERP